jgi:hypothetical protein
MAMPCSVDGLDYPICRPRVVQQLSWAVVADRRANAGGGLKPTVFPVNRPDGKNLVNRGREALRRDTDPIKDGAKWII